MSIYPSYPILEFSFAIFAAKHLFAFAQISLFTFQVNKEFMEYNGAQQRIVNSMRMPFSEVVNKLIDLSRKRK